MPGRYVDAVCRLILVLMIGWQESVWAVGEDGFWLAEHMRTYLQSRLEGVSSTSRMQVAGRGLMAIEPLLRFYEQRHYELAWSDEAGPGGRADTLLKSIGEAEQEGLRPEDYHYQAIIDLLKEVRQQYRTFLHIDTARLVDLDLLLTDAFLLYGTHLLTGRVNPATIQAQWYTERRQGDLVQALRQALDTNQIGEVLHAMQPPQAGYLRLKQVLGRYRVLAKQGGWPQVAAGPNMQLGDVDRRVSMLRKRLHITGDLAKTAQRDLDMFDEQVERAVRRFQTRHGLSVDGVVGPATLAALNVPVQDRIKQIRANLERWRWLPHQLGRRHIVVNIARFTLEVVEDDHPVMSMRIIVGRPYRDTPVFSSQITSLVLNPSWNVPPRIAVEDKLPLIRQDSSYLARNHMKVFRGWGSEAREIDPTTVNWAKVSAEKFPYRLQQTPGPLNALGQMKFFLPNPFDVYLHDTPSRDLFNRSIRTFSSGCVRVEKPMELATYVLRGTERWTQDLLTATIERGREQAIRVASPVPVHLLYWTAWVEAEGTVHFRDDIYQRDTLLDKALNSLPTTARRSS
jgi:murein L,D-transpeptidase YcbB/YkuD